MKTVKFAIFVLVSLFSISAFAQVPQCPDEDKDGYAVCSTTCLAKNCGDCDDKHVNVNPGMTEIWEDGLDNDCKDDVPGQKNLDGTAANGDRLSLGAVYVARFSKSLGRSITPKSPSELQLLKELMVCRGAGANCKVDYTDGTITPAKGFRMLDTDCDGLFNIVPDSYSQTVADKEKCEKVAKKAAARSTPKASGGVKAAPAIQLPAGATPVVAAPAPSKALFSVVQRQAAAADAKADKALETANKASAKVDTFDAALKGHGEQLSVLDQALKAEEARAKAEEARIKGIAQAGLDRATEAKADIEELKEDIFYLKTKGGFLEGYAGGGFIVQRDFDVTPKGAKKPVLVRDQVAGAAELGANLGFETKGSRFNLFGAFSPNWDLGDVSMGATGGAEVTWRLGGSQSYLGVHGLYQRHHAGGNVVYTNAVGNAFGGGATFVFRGADQAHLGIQARLTAAWETFGTDVHRKDIQDGPVIRLMIDVLAGYSLASN